jgi:hypothetical protein
MPLTEPRGSLLDRVAALPRAVLIAVAALTFASLAVWGMWDESNVFDEGAHLSTGHRILSLRDYRIDPLALPAVKSLTAIPVVLQDVRDPDDSEFENYFLYAYAFLYRSGNDAGRLLASGRLVVVGMGVVLLGVVYAFAHELHGARGGFVALMLATFSPNLLAHGHLVTLDLGTTLFWLLTLYAFFRLTRNVTPWRLLACGLALGTALASKMTSLLLLPTLALAIAVFVLAGGHWKLGRGPERLRGTVERRPWLVAALLLLVAGSVALTVVWGFYGFRYAASADPAVALEWKEGPAWVVVARDHRLLPEGYLHAISKAHWLVYGEATERISYALGTYSTGGRWWYFPFSFLVKTPLAALALYVLGVVALVRAASRETLRNHAWLVAGLVVYWAGSIGGELNVGNRHILPVYPMLMILAGGAASLVRRAAWLQLLLAGVVSSGLLAAPHFLAYFNLPSTLIFERHHMLVESSLDWGQDLPGLKRWMDDNGVEEIKLAYFGSASPAYYGIRHQKLPGYNVYSTFEKQWPPVQRLEPGDRVAISATNLRGLYLPRKDTYERFLDEEPVATIGHSILIYRIP